MPQRLKAYWLQSARDWNYIFRHELRRLFRDQGIFVFFFIVPLAYPLLYAFIYTGEVVRDVPVAVVDESHTSQSRTFLRQVDATADVRLIARCADMQEAQRLVAHREAYGILRIPADFSSQLARGEQTHVAVYPDMSGMLYYKALLVAATNASLAMNADIKVARAGNTTAQQDRATIHPIAYEEVNLYNPQGGFASFLIPAVLILVIQQTLLLGVGLAAGTAREHNRFRLLLPATRHYNGLLRIVLGKAAAYLMVYIPLSVYVLGVVPRLFRLPQIGATSDWALFVLPFLLACIFFAMTVSALVRHRETCIMLIVFTSVPLLFISGVSWPGSAVPEVWQAVSYLFPSTAGINGFLKINNMGAPLSALQQEYHLLWAQATIYFLLTCLVYKHSITTSRRRYIAAYRKMRAAKAASPAG